MARLPQGGWKDLYVCQDFGQHQPSELLWNRGRSLEPDPGAAGLRFRMNGMGGGRGDLNRDGRPGFLFTAQQDVRMIESAGDVRFETGPSGGIGADRLRGPSYGWGVEIGDLDNDGDKDAAVGFGHWCPFDGIGAQEDSVDRQASSGAFEDVGVEEGVVDDGRTRGVWMVDLDRDGCLDLLRRIGMPLAVRGRVVGGRAPGHGGQHPGGQGLGPHHDA